MAKGTTFIVKHKYSDKRNLEDVLISMIMRESRTNGINTGGKVLAGTENGRYNRDKREVAKDFNSSKENEVIVVSSGNEEEQ